MRPVSARLPSNCLKDPCSPDRKHRARKERRLWAVRPGVEGNLGPALAHGARALGRPAKPPLRLERGLPGATRALQPKLPVVNEPLALEAHAPGQAPASVLTPKVGAEVGTRQGRQQVSGGSRAPPLSAVGQSSPPPLAGHTSPRAKPGIASHLFGVAFRAERQWLSGHRVGETRTAGRVLGLAHLTQVQKAFQEGKLGLDVGKNVPATRCLAVPRGSEFPVGAGMQAELSGVMEMEAQRPKIWDCVTSSW